MQGGRWWRDRTSGSKPNRIHTEDPKKNKYAWMVLFPFESNKWLGGTNTDWNLQLIVIIACDCAFEVGWMLQRLICSFLFHHRDSDWLDQSVISASFLEGVVLGRPRSETTSADVRRSAADWRRMRWTRSQFVDDSQLQTKSEFRRSCQILRRRK